MSDRIRVMLVDDSAVVRGLFDRALREDGAFEVVASAANGEIAISMLRKTPVDVIVLDVEMPVMDGMTALPELLAIAPKTRVIMASTLSTRNAEISVRAMQMGAADYIAKPSTRDAGQVSEFYRELIAKVKALAPHVRATSNPVPPAASKAPAAQARTHEMPSPIPAPTQALKRAEQMRSMEALAIASSTGGPQALLHIFREFRGVSLRTPIFITQQMPPNFTAILADHISKASGFDCHEAIDEEEVKPGIIYLAPGDYHLTATRVGTSACRIKLNQDPPENFCRPSADPMFRSLAKIYNDKLVAAVLTGLGSDGARGASAIVASGGGVVTQDEASCVVYGMPKSVADAKLTSAVFALNAIAPFLIKAVT
ncbi:MAG: chemotaxis response regulator protein-glutamate methylesterase [Alphaproteobacteria bacterium]|nr:chemotaxis response regulator protein-glutamate methylesterase [Alphaproteobacteria bacterium]